MAEQKSLDFWATTSWSAAGASSAAVPVSDGSKPVGAAESGGRTNSRFAPSPGYVPPSATPLQADAAEAWVDGVSPDVECRNLSFTYSGSTEPVLKNISFSLPKGARCLVIGANGAGKSTLLRILGGRHMIPRGAAFCLGRPAFHDTRLVSDVALIAERWAMTGDVGVEDLMRSCPPEALERTRVLLDVLEINPQWRCYRLSDGQRRRVQILVNFMRAVRLMLLDEITTDLDVVGRQNLLKYLYKESERGATQLYATHIFDGLDGWATHVMYIRDGEMVRFGPVADFPELSASLGVRSPLFVMVESWLRQEWERRRLEAPKADDAQAGMSDIQMFTDRTRGESLPVP